MVWGCFSEKKGRGSLFFSPPHKTTTYSQICMSVLGEKLLPCLTLHVVTKFLQDEAPCPQPKLERAIEMMRVKDLPLSLFKKVAHTMPATVG